MFRVRIPLLGGLGKNFPNDWDSDLTDDNANGKYVDMTLAVFPVRPIHGKHPSARRTWKLMKDETTNSSQAQGGFEEEVLEPSVTTFILGARVIFRGQNGEVYSALSK